MTHELGSIAFDAWCDAVSLSRVAAAHAAAECAETALLLEKTERQKDSEAADATRLLLMDLQQCYLTLQSDTAAAIANTRAWADARVAQADSAQTHAHTVSRTVICQKISVFMELPGWKQIYILRLQAALQVLVAFTQRSRHQKRTMAKAIARMRSQILFEAWTCWSAAVRDRKHRALLHHKVALNFFHHLLNKAWRAWKHLAWDVADARRLASRAVMRLSLKLQASALNQWLRLAAVRKERRAHQQRIVARVIQRLRNRVLGAAWSAWNAEVAARKRAEDMRQKVRHTGTRALYRLKNRTAAGAFSAWAAMIAETRRQKRVMNNIIARMTHHRKAAAFSGWRFRIQSAARSRRILAQVLSRQQHLTAWKALAAWKHWLAQLQQKQETATAVVGHLANQSLGVPFRRWRVTVQKLRLMAAKMHRALARLMRLALSAAWRSWHEATYRATVVRSIVRRAVLRLRRLQASRCFGSWLAVVKEKHHFRGVMTRALTRLISRSLYRAFRRWAELWRLRKMMTTAVQRLRSRVLHLAFTRWERCAHASRKLALSGTIPAAVQKHIDGLTDALSATRDELDAARTALSKDTPREQLEQSKAALAESQGEASKLRKIIKTYRENAKSEIENGFRKGEQDARRHINALERQRRERHEAQLIEAEEAARKAAEQAEEHRRRHRADADFHRRSLDDLERHHADNLAAVTRRCKRLARAFAAHQSSQIRTDTLRRAVAAWRVALPRPSGAVARRAAVAPPAEGVPPVSARTARAPMKTGMLEKWKISGDESDGEWKSRHCALVDLGSTGVVLSYRKNPTSRELGRIRCRGSSVVSTVEAAGRLPFALVSDQGERFTFAAPSEAERGAWIAALARACERSEQ